MKTERKNTTVTRVAIPAHIYIAIETPTDYTDAQIIEEATKRVIEVEQRREYLSVCGFEHDEHVLVYPNREVPPQIEDRNW